MKSKKQITDSKLPPGVIKYRCNFNVLFNVYFTIQTKKYNN